MWFFFFFFPPVPRLSGAGHHHLTSVTTITAASHHGARLWTLWRARQGISYPAGRAYERTPQPYPQRPLQLLPHTHPAGAHQREEGQKGALLPQRRPLLQGHRVRRGQRQISHLWLAPGWPHALAVWPHQLATGCPLHLHYRRHAQDLNLGWARGR